MNKLLIICLFSIVSAQAFVTKSLYFEDLLVKKFPTVSQLNIVLMQVDHVSLKFKQLTESIKTDPAEIIDFYAVNFTVDGNKHTCLGTIIKETERLSVSNFPETHQDRAGYVVLDECRGLELEEPLTFYAVFPMNKTLPVGSISGIDSYRMYREYTTTRPQILCTDNDSNFEGVPRSQTTIHAINDRLLWSTGISRSSPNTLVCDPEDVTKCEEIENDDRALYIEDMDQSSMAETREFLNFLSLKLNGVINMSFAKGSCISIDQDGMDLRYCEGRGLERQAWSEKFKYTSGDTDYRLSRITARYESQKKTQIAIGANNEIGTRDTLDVVVEYHFLFIAEGVRPKFIKLQTRYRNTPIESQPECRKL